MAFQWEDFVIKHAGMSTGQSLWWKKHLENTQGFNRKKGSYHLDLLKKKNKASKK